MTREESIKLLALIKVAYPTAYKDMDDATKRATVAMWHSTFLNMPYAIMELAFENFRRYSKFPPTVADMFDEIENLYHKSLSDLFQARVCGDKELERRCQFVMEQTSGYRGNDLAINYGSIPDNLLTQNETMMIGEGSDVSMQ